MLLQHMYLCHCENYLDLILNWLRIRNDPQNMLCYYTLKNILKLSKHLHNATSYICHCWIHLQFVFCWLRFHALLNMKGKNLQTKTDFACSHCAFGILWNSMASAGNGFRSNSCCKGTIQRVLFPAAVTLRSRVPVYPWESEAVSFYPDHL